MEIESEETHSALQQLKSLGEEELKSLELFFEYDDGRPLIKGGQEIKVNQQNLQKFIELKSKFYCYRSARDEILAVKKGINKVFDCQLLSSFTWE